jgi:hypothetical protein
MRMHEQINARANTILWVLIPVCIERLVSRGGIGSQSGGLSTWTRVAFPDKCPLAQLLVNSATRSPTRKRRKAEKPDPQSDPQKVRPSRQRSRVRAPSSPPHIPKQLWDDLAKRNQ